MTRSLLEEFIRGFEYRLATLSDQPDHSACPYLATSHCADAWHAGQWHAQLALRANHDLKAAKPSKVWHGRGYLVNVAGNSAAQAGNEASYQFAYHVDYSGKRVTVSIR